MNNDVTRGRYRADTQRRDRRPLGVAVGATVALIAGVLSAGAANAHEPRSPSTCLVKAGTTGPVVSSAGGQALTDALAGSEATIYVGGICTGNFIIDRNVTVIGGLRAKGSRSEEVAAILDGQGAGRVISVDSETAIVTLSRLTIRNGNGIDGGGISNGGGSLTVIRSRVSGNTAGFGGGISSCGGGSLTVILSRVTGNTAGFGGGISICGGGNATLTNSTVSGNTATDSRGEGGGGIYNSVSTVRLIKSKVTRNSAATGGGIKNSFGTMALIKSKVSRNSAATGGGIVNVGESGDLTLTDSTVTDNTAATVSVFLGGAVGGGGILNGAGATVTLDGRTRITRNTATNGGGIRNHMGTFLGTDGTLTTTDSWTGTTCGNSPDDFRAVKGNSYGGQTADSC